MFLFSLMYVCTFQPPEFDNCAMLTIDYYDVRINSSGDEILSQRVHNKTTLSFVYFNNHPSVTFTASILQLLILKDREVIQQFL